VRYRSWNDTHLLDDLTGIAGQGTKEGAVAVHDDYAGLGKCAGAISWALTEAKFGIALEELGEGLSVEFVVTKVERRVCASRQQVLRMFSGDPAATH
jgi:hypothetical protein